MLKEIQTKVRNRRKREENLSVPLPSNAPSLQSSRLNTQKSQKQMLKFSRGQTRKKSSISQKSHSLLPKRRRSSKRDEKPETSLFMHSAKNQDKKR
jgi:hypothetical protein